MKWYGRYGKLTQYAFCLYGIKVMCVSVREVTNRSSPHAPTYYDLSLRKAHVWTNARVSTLAHISHFTFVSILSKSEIYAVSHEEKSRNLLKNGATPR